MKKILFFFVSMVIILSACKSDYEMIRTSGDTPTILEGANKYFDEGDFTKAISLYELILPSIRGQADGEETYYKYAEAHYLNRSYLLAAHYFKTFSDTYGNSPKREDAMFMTAYSNYKTSPRFKLDQTNSDKAVTGFQLFVNTFPNSERVEECNNLIDELRKKKEIKEFESGKLYFNMKKYSAAVVTLENMLLTYPETKNQEEARYLIAKADFLLARNSIFTVQEERFTNAVKNCDRFIKKYPESKNIKEVMNFRDVSLKELKQAQNG